MPKAKKVSAEVVESKETVVVAPVLYTLVAKFYSKDKEGVKTLNTFESKGDTVKELLNNLKFPKGLNQNVVLSVTHGDKSHEASVAPFRVRAILEDKDAYEFDRVFRGI